MLAEPVIALTVELAAKVMRISLLSFRYCCISQVSAMRFALNSSSSVIPPFTAAVATTEKPPDKNEDFQMYWTENDIELEEGEEHTILLDRKKIEAAWDELSMKCKLYEFQR